MGAADRAQQPPDGDERGILTGWLAFHRDALAAKSEGLTDDQPVERAVTPSALSLLGLVRHLAEMERAYGVWALGPRSELEWVWGSDTDDAEDDIDCDVTMVAESMRGWRSEMRRTDDALSSHPTLDEVCDGNGFSVRWNLAKLIGEYARHNGHADLIRERIHGQTGE
ncbi:DUF664 domain-containing protein [Ornithinimicrobium cerasi]|uniref:mycothiol transferase n=1 Tax=Ornithinimicrobium cerasi TaxID=2248773 RepID=UPI000EFEE2DC|nr:DUF664 domain-containing protein [Ornithinimicrobium cerasi]